jgi:hypothetical protein
VEHADYRHDENIGSVERRVVLDRLNPQLRHERLDVRVRQPLFDFVEHVRWNHLDTERLLLLYVEL